MRNTSQLAYNQIKDSGLLKGMQWAAYAMLAMTGPATARELERAAADAPLFGSKMDPISYHKRLSELKKLGVVVERTIRPCRITKRTAIVWDLSDALPKKMIRRKRRLIWIQAEIVNKYLSKPVDYTNAIPFREMNHD